MPAKKRSTKTQQAEHTPAISGRVRGGIARAQKLSDEERSAIARRGAAARWSGGMPKATHAGELHIGDTVLTCAVLDSGERVLSQNTFVRAIGRQGNLKTSIVEAEDFEIPTFLSAQNLKPFLPKDIASTSTPVRFVGLVGGGAGRLQLGYKADLLATVCEVYQDARDARKLLPSQEAIADACKLLYRGFANVGIVALVDEATGYQEIRDRLALQKILDAYLRKELAAWAKRFPDEFYKELFRLRGWPWPPVNMQGPRVVAKYTNDLVYARLAPDLLAELEARNPKNERGRRRAKHHMWLTDEIGLPALAQHLHAITALMRASDGWDAFKQLVDRALPVRTDLSDLPLFGKEVPGS